MEDPEKQERPNSPARGASDPSGAEAPGGFGYADAMLDLLLDCAREYAIFIVDTENRIVTWSGGAERILGWSKGEAVGQPGAMVFTPEQRLAGVPEQEIETARAHGEAQNERMHQRKDGSQFWGSGMMFALRDGGGHLHGFAKILRDQTRERQATVERERLLQELTSERTRLRELNETLEQRVKERTRQVRLLATRLAAAEQAERRRISEVLHDELQQLLFGIQVKLSLARTDAAEGDRDGLLAGLDEANTWIGKVIESTRRLALDLTPSVVKGEGLAGNLRWLAAQMQEVYGLHVDVRAPEAVRLQDDVARELLFQVTRELLFNVIKHADTAKASVGLSLDEGHLHLRVADGGKGFDAQEVLREGRSSLGLSSVLERIEHLGGHVEIVAAPGRGTEILITVPVVAG